MMGDQPQFMPGGREVTAQWLTMVRQDLRMHDAQPAGARALVREFNVKKGLEMWREMMPKCPHGRHEPSCAQCTWEKSDRGRR